MNFVMNLLLTLHPLISFAYSAYIYCCDETVCCYFYGLAVTVSCNCTTFFVVREF